MNAVDSSVTGSGNAALADANGILIAIPRFTVNQAAHSKRRRKMQTRLIVMSFLLALLVVPAVGYGASAVEDREQP